MSTRYEQRHNDNEFRDHIATIDDKGKRAWVFPKKPSGKWYGYRKTLSWFLLAFLFAAPFVKINGNQFLLFNVIERRFSIFGFPFWPQDFHLFVISMVIGVVFVALFTVAFGRIFCGWICPQTIFMEMVFRRIEFWIEGDRNAQMKLAKQEWNAEKIRKKGLKWFMFFVISFVIANVFLAYVTGSDELLQMVTEGPEKNMGTLVALLIFTAVFYFIYGWFREQVCIIACPYGRLQGALLDDKSVIVAYDHVRGEGEKGRGRMVKNEVRPTVGKGDCIDCKLCVAVCPTGIDIRNGTQLECINCTACIDECNTVMDKVGFPQGLIRYASEAEITKKEKFTFTNRMKGYTAVLVILMGVFTGMLFLRNSVQATVLRLPGQLYEHKGSNISNVYTFKILNKTENDIDNVRFKLENVKGTVKMVGKQTLTLPKAGTTQGTLFIEINQALLEKDKTKIVLGVYRGDKRIDTESTNFLGPRTFN
ncbi:cytochrome C oxidase [Flavobacterium akiainvivens]|uniref:Cytochrome C oxidase n=1 Tax=Flavobacterium akiainvivens TaxID=1202724 RepID=A0A0M9VHM0_9FLAO|nr:cytochrome c oxidase accessory protein CcoG [Flavobacterium akiainvivens]KOS05720.1 cytochrome C oxidase [Flavobacterium akiainvivens]SFQ37270.1 cytochrome c oxidase accessory protein FixG [Flavobacterium akiainvivens]